MSHQQIHVALIGCGRIAGHHARSIAATEGVRLEAVCDLVEEKARKYGEEFGVAHFTNYHEMFRKIPAIDLVAVATPSGMHFEHATEIMRAYGKNMIMEKPTFLRPSQVIEAYDLAARMGLKLFPVFQNRYNRAVQRVHRALSNGELGGIRISAVRVRWCRPQRYYNLAPWRGTFAQDGGALTNQGVHHVDLLRYLGGEVSAVNATMRTLGAAIEVEDTAVATLRYANSAVGNLEVTTAARPDDFEASISLVCENGLAQIGGIAVNELQVFTPDPPACKENSEDFSGNVYGHGHAAMYRDIARSLLENVAYPVSRDDCLRTIRLLHAFYRSDELGQWVDVDSNEESTRLGRPDEALADQYRTREPVESSDPR
ncbi:MAG TPA: Gfo/Idh/MocA family oxidoreductase [Thermoanaerobaculia bacterium]|nr:Gfo/Idh/MocA family oxidoreductase [Thermoanaerobaculia bacterium]